MNLQDRKVAWLYERVCDCRFPAPESRAGDTLHILHLLVNRASMMFGMVVELDEPTRLEMIDVCKDVLVEWYRFHADDATMRVEIWNQLAKLDIDLGEPAPSTELEAEARRLAAEANAKAEEAHRERKRAKRRARRQRRKAAAR